MRKAVLYLFLTTVIGGSVFGGTAAASGSLAIALPQPSTILICTAGMAFFRFVSKRVP